MWRKRKSSSSDSSDLAENSRKRRWKESYVILSSDDESENDRSSLAEDEWYINCILDETKTHYLIDWEGPWSPTWEPKEHANEAAIEVWEKKREEKKRKNLQKSKNQPTVASPTQSSSPRREIRISESPDPDPEPRERKSESPLSNDRPDSPLFVPFPCEPDPDYSTEPRSPPEAVSKLRQAPPASQESNGSQLGTNKETNRKAPSSITKPYTPVGVFEYITRSTIPSRYRLPGEIAKPNSPAEFWQPRSSVIQATQPSSLVSVGVRGKQIHEIAETPSIPSSIRESQRTRAILSAKNSGSQPSITSVSQKSNYSSLVSQLSSSALWPAGRTSICSPVTCRIGPVPETTFSLQSQSSARFSEQGLVHQSTPVGRKTFISETPQVIMMDGHTNDRETPSLAETMEKYSQFEGSTPREKLRNAYAQLQAMNNSGTPSNTDTSITSSSAGDIEPVAMLVPETTVPLSVRDDKGPVPHTTHREGELHPSGPIIEPTIGPAEPTLQTIHPSALTVSHQEQAAPGAVHLGPSEFAVLLPMDSRVKDDYEQMLKDETQSIGEYLNIPTSQVEPSRSEHERLLSRMHGLLEHLSNVSTHPDLNIAEHINDFDSDLAKEAAWAEYSSAKFLLLGYLVDMASNHDLHLVIMVHGTKTLQNVERFLMGKGLSYARPRQEMGFGTNLEVSMVKGSLSFGIQSTLDDGIMEAYKPPTAIIALDRSFNAKSPSVEHMRTTYARHGNLLPVIRLLVSNSSEHVELCFASSPEPQRLRLIVQYTVRLREAVGDLQDNSFGVQENSEAIVSCLLSGNFNSHWTLPSIKPLNLVSSDELDAALSARIQADAASLSNPQTQKRSFVNNAAEQASKRRRMHMSQDISQLTESSKESTKFPSQTLDNDLEALEAHLMQLKTSHAAELEKLHKALADAQSRLQEREGVLSKLQHRYESRTMEFHTVRQERDRLAENKGASEQRLEKQKDEIMKLKDERTQLRHELEKARETLKTGGGSMAELETAQEEIRRLNKDNAGLERKAEYEAKQAEYTREQYQNASNMAAQFGNEIRQLRLENESLKRKVAVDASRLREINLKNDEARHLSRVKELEATLASREDLLRRKEDELRDIRKNRPSTRSTSTQPRSPKWNTANSRPSSPGINNSNGSGFSGRGSGLRFSSEVPL